MASASAAPGCVMGTMTVKMTLMSRTVVSVGRGQQILWALLGKDFLSEIRPWPLSPWVFSFCSVLLPPLLDS